MVVAAIHRDRPGPILARTDGRPHGFAQQTFADQRGHTLALSIHVWSMQRTPLTPEAFVPLLVEAIDALEYPRRPPR